jgi:hypothetical protein
VQDGATTQLREIDHFISVLQIAIPTHNRDVIGLTVDTVGGELRNLVEGFPGIKDTTVNGGLEQRLAARKELKNLVLKVRRIGVLAADGLFDEALAEFDGYRMLTFVGGGELNGAVPLALMAARPWSLFNPDVHKAHFEELRKLLQSAQKLPQH